MFTKLLFALLLVLLAGCSNEGEKYGEGIQVESKVGATSCLTHFADHMTAYFDGRLAEKEIRSFWDCTAGAVDEFAKITTGSAGGEYTPEGLWSFLHKYFLVNQVVDSKLLRSVMEAKRVIVGGSTERVTKAELELLIGFLNEMKAVSVELNPHIRIITQTEARATDEQLAAANSSIERALLRLSGWMTRRNQDYSFVQLREFFDGLARNSSTPETLLRWRDGVPILAQAKAIAVGLPKESVAASQWQAFFLSAGTGYGLLLNWRYGFQQDLFGAFPRPLMRDTLDRFADVLEQGVMARQRLNSSIGLVEFDALFSLLEEQRLLGTIKATSLSSGLRWVVARLLSRTDVTRLPVNQGIEMRHVKVLRDILNDWDDVSLFADRWPGGKPSQPRVREFAALLDSSWPLLVDAEGRVQFSSGGASALYDPKSLHVLAWQFMVVSWLRDAFVPAGSIEMEIQQMEIAVKEVLPLIQSFGYLSETGLDVYKRLQKEADLFMPSSDGNLTIGIEEGTNFLSFLVSSYKAGEFWNSQVGVSCGQPADPHCFRDALFKSRDRTLESMPGLKQMFATKGLSDWQDFSKLVETTVMKGPAVKPWVTGDRVLFFMLLHYLESFVQRYDSDASGLISELESMFAFNVFQENLERLFSPLGMPSEDVKPFFTFLLKNGETYFNRYGGQIEFIHWKLHPEEWKYDSNRYTLVNILYELSKL